MDRELRKFIHFSSIAFLSGTVCLFFGLCALVPLFVFFLNDLSLMVRPFLLSASICVFVGSLLMIGFYSKHQIELHSRDIFLLTCITWIVAPICSSLPFFFYPVELISWSEALFESVSALSTTGWSYFDSADFVINEMIFWRSFLHWIGGIGIIILLLAIFPSPKLGGLQLMRAEFSDRSEKFFPKISQIALSCLGLYSFISFLCFAFSYRYLNAIDALCFSMSTVSTAGFPIDFLNPPSAISNIRWISMFFSALSSIPFVLLIQALLNKKFSLFYKNFEVISFFAIWFFSSAILIFIKVIVLHISQICDYKNVMFSVISSMSTSGIVDSKESASNLFFLMLSMIGGSAGSTAGGFKISRLITLFAVLFSYIRQQIHPNGVFIPHIGKRYIKSEEISSILIFTMLFFITYFILNLIFMIYGISKWYAMVYGIAALSNSGDSSLIFNSIILHSVFLKYVLIVSMIIGRLELLPIFILFHRAFWKP